MRPAIKRDSKYRDFFPIVPNQALLIGELNASTEGFFITRYMRTRHCVIVRLNDFGTSETFSYQILRRKLNSVC
jgi:hypothetical protein